MGLLSGVTFGQVDAELLQEPKKKHKKVGAGDIGTRAWPLARPLPGSAPECLTRGCAAHALQEKKKQKSSKSHKHKDKDRRGRDEAGGAHPSLATLHTTGCLEPARRLRAPIP
jgi:hypothetical protein